MLHTIDYKHFAVILSNGQTLATFEGAVLAKPALPGDTVDYLDENGAVQQYEPDSDMDFVAFKKLMLEEWAARPWRCCVGRS
jgi:hypothetical protein